MASELPPPNYATNRVWGTGYHTRNALANAERRRRRRRVGMGVTVKSMAVVRTSLSWTLEVSWPQKKSL